jgi:hypothetical protein
LRRQNLVTPWSVFLSSSPSPRPLSTKCEESLRLGRRLPRPFGKGDDVAQGRSAERDQLLGPYHQNEDADLSTRLLKALRNGLPYPLGAPPVTRAILPLRESACGTEE